jgi:SAM-dependent methyltransferase
VNKLTAEQLGKIPWNKKFITGANVPPEPEIEDIPSLLNIPFLKRDSKYGQFYTWYEIVKMVGEAPLSVLDAACGRGQICQILKFYGHEITGADIDNCFSADEDIPFLEVDLDQDFLFVDKSFDVVINSTALLYLKSSEHFFNETKRILKPNGRIIFSITNIENIGSRYYFFKTGKFGDYSNAILSRKNFLYPDYIFKLLDSLGFKVNSIVPTVPIINYKLKIIDLFFGKILFTEFKNHEKWKYSSSLIIEALKK